MLRDRDAPVTREGIVLRVYGYDHPPGKYICDVEYAPETLFKSPMPKALRDGGPVKYYKFYEDEGLRFVLERYPQYTTLLKPLGLRVVAVSEEEVAEVRDPQKGLLKLVEKGDPMSKAVEELLQVVEGSSKLTYKCFGVFGSLLHDFYRVDLSDLDFTVYGMSELKELREVLSELYSEGSLRNEFEVVDSSKFSRWRFKNYTLGEYVYHQWRKLIYGVIESKSLGRPVKFEFEPVLKWDEIINEYSDDCEVECLGFVEALVEVVDDRYSPFMPSKYGVELVELISGFRDANPTRVVSYVEEFRMQLFEGEVGFVAGWLEEVRCGGRSFQQIVLTRRERYYDQVLKLVRG